MKRWTMCNGQRRMTWNPSPLVLRLAEDWNLAPGINDHLAKESAKARTQLEELIALIDQARPFSMEVRIAKELADAAKANGEKPN